MYCSIHGVWKCSATACQPLTKTELKQLKKSVRELQRRYPKR